LSDVLIYTFQKVSEIMQNVDFTSVGQVASGQASGNRFEKLALKPSRIGFIAQYSELPDKPVAVILKCQPNL